MSIRYDAERKGTGGPMNPIVIKLGLCPYSDGG
jgi:hypothetical protein